MNTKKPAPTGDGYPGTAQFIYAESLSENTSSDILVKSSASCKQWQQPPAGPHHHQQEEGVNLKRRYAAEEECSFPHRKKKTSNTSALSGTSLASALRQEEQGMNSLALPPYHTRYDPPSVLLRVRNEEDYGDRVLKNFIEALFRSIK